MAEQPSPLTEAERLDAAIAALLAERVRRRGGKWPEVQVQIVEGGKLSAHGDEPPSPQKHEYPPELIVFEVIDPEPVVELPSEQWGQPDALDVTPPPYRPPMPPQEPPRATPKGHNNAGIPPEIHARALKQLANFERDIYDPADAPIRYRSKPHGGW